MTRVYGLIGKSLGHSLSPLLHREIFARTGYEGVYGLFETPGDSAWRAGEALRTLGIAGANVTIPYKRVLLEQMDALSPEAQAIGAINTIVRTDGGLVGYNTDYDGFGAMLDAAGISCSGRAAVLLGCGGAALAAAAYLLDHGAGPVYAVSRRKGQGELLGGVPVIGYDRLRGLAGGLLINATPVGMWPGIDACPVDAAVVGRFDAVADLIYNPAETMLMRLGRIAGKPVCGGLTMLARQAIRAQELWQGRALEAGLLPELRRVLEVSLHG